MRYFTRQQIDEIRKQLATLGIRDTDLITASSLSGNEYVAIVQGGVNKKISLTKLFEQFLNGDGIEELVNGKSAYELAQEEGFVGTLAEWLESLVGPQGPTGPTGPQGPAGLTNLTVSVDDGVGVPSAEVTKSGQDFHISFHNLKGDPGEDGQDGGGGSSYTLPAATSSVLGGIKIGHSGGSGKAGVKLDASNKAYIDVPAASSSGLGGFKTGFSETGDNYAVKLDSSNKAYVTVPAGSGSGSGGSGTDGADGGHWDQAFCATASESVVPTVPASADPLDGTYGTYRWSHDAPTNATGGYVIWQVVRWVAGDGTAEAWQGPWRISGAEGDAGVDGTRYEYIYTRTNSETSSTPSLTNTTPQPSSSGGGSGLVPTDDDFVPLNWYDNPQGVYDVDGQRIEWMAFRTRNPQYSNGQIVRDSNGDIVYEWSAFVGPIIWSAYGKSGTDGDGVEYIYAKGTYYPDSDNPANWSTSAADFQTREYIPNASKYSNGGIWQDDPFDLTSEQPGTKQWVSVRKKYADTTGATPTWHAYSAPKLWNYAPKDGDAGIGVFVDYDNELIAVGLDSNNKNYALNQASEITMYNGISAVTSATVSSITVKHGNTDVTSTYTTTQTGMSYNYVDVETSGTHKYIRVHLPADLVDLSEYGLDIYVTMSAAVGTETVSRTAVLQVIGVNFGTNGHSFRLNLGTPVVKKSRAGVYSPAAIEPTCEWVDGDTPQVPFTPSSPRTGFTFEYAFGDDALAACPNSISTSNMSDPLRVVLKYNNMLVDKETVYLIEDGSNGDNAIHLDLDNENDTMLFDDDDELLSGDAVTNATLYDGSDAISASNVDFIISSYVGCTSSDVTISGNTVTVSYLSDSGYVMVRAEYPKNSGNYYFSKFTLKKQVNGAKYWLVVSPDAIAYNTTTQVASDSAVTVSVKKGVQNSSGSYEVSTLQTLPYSANTGGMYLTINNGSRVTGYSDGQYQFSVDPSLTKYTIKLINVTFVEIPAAIGGGSLPTMSAETEVLDEETVPICKSADGADGQDGSNGLDGKDALPLRLRPWSQVYRPAGTTPLSGNEKIFSGYEDNAPFRDVIILTAENYEGAATSYPFTEDDKDMPIALVINYSTTHSTGYDGSELVLPYGVGDDSSNYSYTIATSKEDSEDLYDGETGVTGKMWGVFLNFGAIFTSLLVATQGYIGNLTVKHLNTAGEDNSILERIVASGNTMYMTDATGAQRFILTGDDVDLSTPTAAYQQTSFTEHRTYRRSGSSAEIGSETITKEIFSGIAVASGDTLRIPAITLNSVLTDNHSGTSEGDAYADTSVTISLYNGNTAVRSLYTGTLTDSDSLTYSGTTITGLTASSYYRVLVTFSVTWGIPGENTVGYASLNLSNVYPYGNAFVYGDKRIALFGANGMCIHLGNSFDAIFALDENDAPLICLQGLNSSNQVIGIKISAAGLQKNTGSGWTSM